jgi:hypothetical protein
MTLKILWQILTTSQQRERKIGAGIFPHDLRLYDSFELDLPLDPATRSTNVVVVVFRRTSLFIFSASQNASLAVECNSKRVGAFEKQRQGRVLWPKE